MQAVGYDAVGSVATLYPTLHTTLCGWWCTDVDTFEVYSRGHFWLRGGVQPWTLSGCTDVDTSGDVDIATGM